MSRIHPKDLLAIPPEEASKLLALESETDEREKVTEFSWAVAIKMFEGKLMERPIHSDMYYMDGRLIKEESYMSHVTVEFCHEYGLMLLDAMTDLIIPVGFKYSSLIGSLSELMEIAFKPVAKRGPVKTVVWVEDIHWNSKSDCITEPFMRHLLLAEIQPYLIAPMKYFDKEVLTCLLARLTSASASASTRSQNQVQTSCEDGTYPMPCEKDTLSWEALSTLMKFAFLLVLRCSSKFSSVIVLQVPQRVAELIGAYELLDFAQAEGHVVKYMKNTATCFEERLHIIDNMVSSLLRSPYVAETINSFKRLRLDLDAGSIVKHEVNGTNIDWNGV